MSVSIDNCGTWIKTTLQKAFSPSSLEVIDQVGKDLYVITIITMMVVFTDVLARLIKKEVVPIEEWVSTISVMLLGGMTLFLRNNDFIKLKSIIVYMIVAISKVVVYRYPFNKRLRFFWSLLAFSNLIVAYTATTNTWAYFQLFGTVGLTVLFIIGQVIYFYFKKHQSSHERFYR